MLCIVHGTRVYVCINTSLLVYIRFCVADKRGAQLVSSISKEVRFKEGSRVRIISVNAMEDGFRMKVTYMRRHSGLRVEVRKSGTCVFSPIQERTIADSGDSKLEKQSSL